jgi:hypothetical protein
MPENPVLTSFECQKRASECRSLASRTAVSLNGGLLLARMAESWESLAVEIELYSPVSAA